MKYSEIFMKQWQTLITDFQVNLEKRKDAGLLPEKLDEWYQLNISRWESSIETEGVILHQQESRELINNLVSQMKSFSFEKIEIVFSKQPMIKSSITFLVGIALGVVEYLVLPIPMLFRTLLAIVVIALMSINALKGIQSGKEKDYKEVRKAYAQQLKNEGEKLLLICQKYD